MAAFLDGRLMGGVCVRREDCNSLSRFIFTSSSDLLDTFLHLSQIQMLSSLFNAN